MYRRRSSLTRLRHLCPLLLQRVTPPAPPCFGIAPGHRRLCAKSSLNSPPILLRTLSHEAIHRSPEMRSDAAVEEEKVAPPFRLAEMGIRLCVVSLYFASL
ncbi:hypothetical protein GUJ93_ZPchr0009g1139 [Zizania palustris]|uniref:Uncharacterized protein n=1 Tax=Zizania palustris TaxID=103762 RepID=A0A8J5VN94_ZIZPA|nr:hypothetical protein GUJ93_ZPchr0009g1139 [Zizania palustris]